MHQERILMIPKKACAIGIAVGKLEQSELNANGTVQLSRCTQIPERWMFVFNIFPAFQCKNDWIESPELSIQTPDKVPVEVRPGINYKNDPIPFPCNRFISGF
jgi:hypothetical protein